MFPDLVLKHVNVLICVHVIIFLSGCQQQDADSKSAEERALEGPRPTKESNEPVPRSVYITPADLDKYGYTKGCRRCQLMREGKSAHGVRHEQRCRERIEKAMKENNDPRISKQEQKILI